MEVDLEVGGGVQVLMLNAPERRNALKPQLPDGHGPPAAGWDAAVQTEQAPQMWSMRRRSGGR